MNEQKETQQNRISTIQAVANAVGREGKILSDNRDTKTIQKKELNTNVFQLAKRTNNFIPKKKKPYSIQKTTISKAKKKTTKRKPQKIRKSEINALKDNWFSDINRKNEIEKDIIKYKEYIVTISKQLDDDDDIALINEYNDELDTIDTSNTENLSTERKKINSIIRNLRFYFPTHSGGFGAKGRAHGIDTAFVAKTSHDVPNGKVLDNHFVENITIDGNTNNQNVFKSTPKVAKEKAGSLQIMGQHYATNSILNKAQLLANIDSGLSSIDTPQDKSFTNTPVGKDRGFGQYANMNNTNATGYAWLAEIPGVLSQRWEWLHIRGAGIGGATDSTNLVAGTRDANTQMIPFESNIRTLATAVGNNKTKYSRLDVKWSVTNRVQKHAYQWIRIAWILYKKNGGKQTQGEANFQPLHTGSNISKKEIEKLETALQEVRSNL
ncbi:hypothetical protein FIA58_004435 [Flavobacterium jejuense]|uniref:Uncharacterized protein n=1 Tax=Flavobacterium jejuense TaxID=1544455 RepID=A0ABX0IMV2_9FLAO|nr:hypothetical protein [Flavobacterium jejuense]NHN24918.1 hypothetical protein [Flavobacterium jejuense]